MAYRLAVTTPEAGHRELWIGGLDDLFAVLRNLGEYDHRGVIRLALYRSGRWADEIPIHGRPALVVIRRST